MRTKFGMEDSKPVSTPLDLNVKLTKVLESSNDSKLDAKVTKQYQSAVGTLIYAMTATRPDISFAVGVVSQYMSSPQQPHWTAVKRILRYLKGTIDYSLQFGGNHHVTYCGYSDADWAGNVEDRRSTTGYTFLVGGAAVSWNSKKQQTVALSTTEAEYMAMTQADSQMSKDGQSNEVLNLLHDSY